MKWHLKLYYINFGFLTTRENLLSADMFATSSQVYNT